MIRVREIVAYLVGATGFFVAVACVVITKHPDDAVIPAWVQAIGSIVAIVAVTVPIYLQQTLARRRAKAVTLATVNAAFGTMSSVADRYVNNDYATSEWWVPQWPIFEQALAQCPIHDVGSAEALAAFLAFREYFSRATAFGDDPRDGSEGPEFTPPLAGLVGYLMSNAGREVETLRRLLA